MLADLSQWVLSHIRDTHSQWRSAALAQTAGTYNNSLLLAAQTMATTQCRHKLEPCQTGMPDLPALQVTQGLLL